MRSVLAFDRKVHDGSANRMIPMKMKHLDMMNVFFPAKIGTIFEKQRPESGYYKLLQIISIDYQQVMFYKYNYNNNLSAPFPQGRRERTGNAFGRGAL